MRQRIVYFDMMRGLIVLLVVIYHACCWGYASPNNMPASYVKINAVLANVRMPILMIVSGYLMHNIIERRRGEIVDRVTQLVWVYAIWMPINVFMHVAEDGLPGGIDELPVKIMMEWAIPTSAMWFLWCLAVFTTLAYLARNVSIWIVIIILAMANAMTYQVPWFSNQLTAMNVTRMAVFFYGGIVFNVRLRLLATSPFSPTYLFILGSVTLIVHHIEDLVHANFNVYAIQGIESALVSMTILCLCRILSRILPAEDGFAKVGRKTLPIYLAHVPLILIFRNSMFGWDGIGYYITPLLLAGIGIAGGLLLHKTAELMSAGWLYRRPAWFDARYVHRALMRLYGLLPDRGMLAGR